MKLKYIVLITPDGIPVPIIFSELLQHKDMVPAGHKVQGAGYVSIRSIGGNVCAFTTGESISLRIKPHEDDEDIINQYI